MKSYIMKFLTMAAVCAISASCGIENLKEQPEAPSAGNRVTLTAVTGNAGATKTYLEDGIHVRWSEKDSLLINGNKYEVSINSENDSLALINGVDESPEYFALYPHTGIDNEDNLVFNIKNVQEYTGGNSFASGTSPMAAYSTGTRLHFSNLCGIIRLGLKGTDTRIRTVRLINNADMDIAGYMAISKSCLIDGSFGPAEFIYNFGPSSRHITVNAADGIALDGNVPEYVNIIVPDMEFASGITVCMTDENGNEGFATTGTSFTVPRNGIVKMEDIFFEITPEMDITVKEAGTNSVSYSFTNAGTSYYKTIIIANDIWNYYINAENWDEGPLAEAFLNLVMPQQNGDSAVEITATESEFSETGLVSGTSYKILAGRCTKAGNLIGKISECNFSTEEAAGSGPEITVKNLPMDLKPYLQTMFIFKSPDAESLQCYIMTKSEYDRLIAGGYTDLTLINAYGAELTESEIQELSGEGHIRYFQNLYPGTEYYLMVLASKSDGTYTFSKTEYRTDPYFSEGIIWEPYSDNAYMECGIFSDFSSSSDYIAIDGIQVEKAAGIDVFRLVNAFDSHKTPELEGMGFTSQPGNYYTIIDAREPYNAYIELLCNISGLSYGGYDTVYIASSSTIVGGQGGEYDEENGIITLYNACTLIGNYYYASNMTVIYLNAKPENPVPGSGNTEDFTSSGGIIEW